MNFGTKLRTILRIAASLQTAIALTTTAIMDTNIKPLIVAWVGFTIATDFVVAAITTYYNNDYTEEACKATGLLRLEKAEEYAEDYVGEDFFDDVEEEDEDEEGDEE